MMIITIIVNITKITMMIRGETGGTHPHSSPVIRRPSKLSWHLTERTVTLCSQCDSVTLCSKFTIPLHTEHYSLHKTCFWHLTERSVTLFSKACTLHTVHCTQDSVVECSTHLTAEQLLFYKKQIYFQHWLTGRCIIAQLGTLHLVFFVSTKTTPLLFPTRPSCQNPELWNMNFWNLVKMFRFTGYLLFQNT